MDHSTIDEHQVIERYVLGRLSEDECARFEEHYLDCSRCLEQLEAAERLQSGLRGVAAEEATQAAARGTVQAAILVGLRRLGGARLSVLAAALGLVVTLSLIPSLTYRFHNQQLHEELAAARAAQVNLPLVFLSPNRSALGETDVELDLSAAAGRIILAIDLGTPDLRCWGQLEGPDGVVLWTAEGLEADASGLITLALPNSVFDSGEHLLELLPRSESTGAPAPIRFRLHVVGA
ncbi:MAG: zf-HC2 domain-containing protein [Acidobacteriota bacterium]|nr:zf-HC2 domain-containing protein [Acidobacteriota bacterium]